jgi:catechol 2,3-dioxygenase-like lactoylglutathione lyase family enzyme
MDYRLEVVVVPVADVDRAKAFYAERVGFAVDHDSSFEGGGRVVQLTPPGSGCSIVIATGLGAEMAPGSRELQLVVHDEAARARARGPRVGSASAAAGARGDGRVAPSSSAIRTATAGPCSGTAGARPPQPERAPPSHGPPAIGRCAEASMKGRDGLSQCNGASITHMRNEWHKRPARGSTAAPPRGGAAGCQRAGRGLGGVPGPARRSAYACPHGFHAGPVAVEKARASRRVADEAELLLVGASQRPASSAIGPQIGAAARRASRSSPPARAAGPVSHATGVAAPQAVDQRRTAPVTARPRRASAPAVSAARSRCRGSGRPCG